MGIITLPQIVRQDVVTQVIDSLPKKNSNGVPPVLPQLSREWESRAMCASSGLESDGNNAAQKEFINLLCAHCPVMQQCLQAAVLEPVSSFTDSSVAIGGMTSNKIRGYIRDYWGKYFPMWCERCGKKFIHESARHKKYCGDTCADIVRRRMSADNKREYYEAATYQADCRECRKTYSRRIDNKGFCTSTCAAVYFSRQRHTLHGASAAQHAWSNGDVIAIESLQKAAMQERAS